MMTPRADFIRLLAGGTAGMLLPTTVCHGAAAASQAINGLPFLEGSMGEDAWERVRSAFLLEPGYRYFNTGGLGPVPAEVLRTCEETARRLQKRSETGQALLAGARRIAARFFGVQTEEIAFTRNATEGNSIIASGLNLAAGDEVIMESHAHPGGSFPWLAQERYRGIRIRFFEPDPTGPDGNLARIAELKTDRTKVIQVSHVTAPTGIVLPVNRIGAWCREQRLWFHVDGAQSAGMLAVNLKGIGCDSYATSGHKWLCGPHETGILYVTRSRLDEVAPYELGGHGAELEMLPGTMKIKDSAMRFESGTRNASSVVGLAAAISWLTSLGMDRVSMRGRDLSWRLRRSLERLPEIEVLTPSKEGMHGSIIAFRSRRIGFRNIADRLIADHRCRCRVVPEQGLNAVRVSTHLCNLESDCDALAESIADVLSRT